VLLGTDTAGKVFAEQTKTVVLSRHGAGVISKYRFAPDEVLTLRLAGSAKEAEVRLVGQIGGEPGRYVHGLAFVDPDLDFWPMEFPAPQPFEPVQQQLSLECTICHARQAVEHSEIEEDVYSVNGSVLRFCPTCGTSTPWTKAVGQAASAEIRKAQPEEQPRLGAAELSGSYRASSSSPASTPSTTYSATALETIPTAVAEATAFEEVAEQHEVAADSSPSISVDRTRRATDAQGRPANRRKHMRVRVNFSGCVREPLGASDVVECTNISKGGLCFHSRKRYPVGSTIEIAAPFAPGTPTLFVPATIKRVEPIGEGQFFRYGVAYLDSKP